MTKIDGKTILTARELSELTEHAIKELEAVIGRLKGLAVPHDMTLAFPYKGSHMAFGGKNSGVYVSVDFERAYAAMLGEVLE